MLSPIWCKIFLKEELKRLDVLTLILAFGGVICINNPFEEATDDKENKKHNYLIGTIVGLTGAFFGSWAMTCMRYMRIGIHHTIAPFYFGTFNVIMSPIAIALVRTTSPEYSNPTTYDFKTILILLSIGAVTTLGQILGSKAF